MTTTDKLNWVNDNNPSFLNKGDNVSVVSVEINNPFVKGIPSYSDFSSDDPVLNSMMPAQVNLGPIRNGPPPNETKKTGLQGQLNYGITSPGNLDNAYQCSGLDYTCTGTSYDSLTFQQCLDKFGEQYQIPEITFNNLIKSLPYTFDVLDHEEKKRYLKLLNNFVNNQSSKYNIHLNKEKVEDKPSENFTNIDYFANPKDCKDKNLSVSGILTIVIILLLILMFVLFITKKNEFKDLN